MLTIIPLLLFEIVARACGCYTVVADDDATVPVGFKFGVATASYQVEGGWNASGKGENIWDRFTHEHPELVTDHSTGDVACDTYHKWREDIQMLVELGVDFHRLSLSWSRILPTGFANFINPDGVRFYSDFIDELLKNNIEPLVTLYHWDLPQPLQDLGGWTNPDTATYFEDFANVSFSLFGDRVKKWITINEPYSMCEDTYGNGNGAPNIKSSGIGDYLCSKNVLLAHAKVFHLYNDTFREKQNGTIGITIDSTWAEPRTNSSEDIEAAERELQMAFGWYAHPIFSKDGDYPEIMKQRVAEKSSLEKFPRSRLPPFSAQEIEMLKGSADFLGLNHYHTTLISDHEYPVTDPPSFQKDKGTSGLRNKRIVPWGFRKLLNWIRKKYDNPVVFITENGIDDDTGTLDDTERVTFMKLYIEAMLSAIKDGCDVRGYTFWSVMDNMEWNSGYTLKFGLYQVDFKSPNRTRTPKASAVVYRSIIKNRRL